MTDANKDETAVAGVPAKTELVLILRETAAAAGSLVSACRMRLCIGGADADRRWQRRTRSSLRAALTLLRNTEASIRKLERHRLIKPETNHAHR